jgi:hypothetical protein
MKSRTMVLSVLSVLLMGLLSYSQTARKPVRGAQEPVEDVGATIGKLEEQMRLATLRGTSNWWVENLAEGYTETDFLGQVHTRDEVIAMQRSKELLYDAWNLSDRTLHTYNGDTAVLTGKLNAEGTYRGQSLSGDFQFTRVWIRKGLEWKLASSHSTRIAP